MASAQEPLLAGVRTAMVTDRGTSPFGIVVTPDGRWAFAALGSSVEVYRIGLSLAPVAVRAIPVPATNRFGVHSASSDLSVVNVAAALAGRPAVIGSIPAGLFPREMALVPGAQRLLITNYQSGQLEAVSVPNIR
jgi:DNA-binding beta-propeller fold protein YncE